LSAGRRGAAILARSGPPSVAVPVSSSIQDTPKRHKRSVRWVAQMRRPAPTKGKIRATQAVAWPFWISGTAPRKVAGADIRFQKMAKAHATRSFDCDRMRIDSKVGRGNADSKRGEPPHQPAATRCREGSMRGPAHEEITPLRTIWRDMQPERLRQKPGVPYAARYTRCSFLNAATARLCLFAA